MLVILYLGLYIMAKQRKNPNSPIRKGYNLEDLYLLRLCIDWLKNPLLYHSLSVQYVPDSVEGQFALDDIVTELDGKYVFYQVKHTQNIDIDKWTFHKLLNKGLAKWIRSFFRVQPSELVSSYMITNGNPSPELAACLQNEYLSLPTLKQTFPSEISVLEKEFSALQLAQFFENCHFIFSLPDQEQYESLLRQEMYQDLKITEPGANRLLLYIANLASKSQPPSIRLIDIREQLLWDNPRSLNQEFIVPEDFEYFNKSRHQQLLKEISGPDGGIRVIIGKPGAGKSTYLAKLYEMLKKKGIAAVRHHYHLNPKDSSYRERLNSDRVVEALRAEFKKFDQEVIGDLSYQNTEDIPLREFLSRISRYFAGRNESFILIIDGLDHVIREGKNEQDLKEFLHEILYPQPGLFILFGTQEIAITAFPNEIYHQHKREDWIEIKGLTREAVLHLVKRNETGLRLPEQTEITREFSEALYQKTAGNPLHLRYVLGEIKNLGMSVHPNDLEEVLPYRNEIGEYYADLWRQLSEISKTICLAIVSLDYKMQEEELLDLAGTLTSFPSDIVPAYKKIKHLIRANLSGVSVYHNSFSVFLLQQEEMGMQRRLLLEKLLHWVQTSSNTDLKWHEEARLEFLLGNPDPLLAFNKSWMMRSFLECRETEQIENLLELAVEAAFQKKSFEKMVYFSELELYFSNRQYNLYEVVMKIWVLAFKLKKWQKLPYPDVSRYNHYEIREILITLHDRGLLEEIPDDVIDRINELIRSNDHESNEVYREWLKIKAAFKTTDLKKIYKNIAGQRDRGEWSANYFSYFVACLLDRKRYDAVNTFLSFQFRPEEKISIIRILVNHDLLNNSNQWKAYIKKWNKSNPASIESLYLFVNGESSIQVAFFEPADIWKKFDDKLRRNDEVVDIYHATFYTSLLLQLDDKHDQVNRWVVALPDDWPAQLFRMSIMISKELAVCFKQKRKSSLKNIFSIIDELPDLPDDDRRDLFDIRRTVIPVLMPIFFRLHRFFNIHNGFEPGIDIEECRLIHNSRWIFASDLVEHFIEKDIELTNESFEEHKKIELESLAKELMPFRDRAERIVHLAMLANDLGKTNEALSLLEEASQFLVTYGYHKDMQLDRIMRSIEVCARGGSLKATQYLRQIAPYVATITQLTDGDETRHFIFSYGTLLSEYDPSLLYNMYVNACKKREYDLAASLFGDILKTLNLDDPVSYALAGTASDHSGYVNLEILAEHNEKGKLALHSIQSTLGKIDYTRRRENTTGRDYLDKDTIDYATIPPGSLQVHLSQLEENDFWSRSYARQKFIGKWADYWLAHAADHVRALTEEIWQAISTNLQEVGSELLDRLYEAVLPFDREIAFQCITWAHANSGGWSDEYHSSMTTSRRRWQLVINEFPERLDEFVETSTFRSGLRYGGEGHHFVAIPKHTQFYVDAGRMDTAERITEAYMNDLEWLFPGPDLPIPEFIEYERTIDPFELLITRFEWISVPVRERAAWQLSELLAKDKDGEYHRFFLEWLRVVALESMVCNGLLVLIKSLRITGSASYQYLNVNSLSASLVNQSRTIRFLLSNIAISLKQDLTDEYVFVMVFSGRKPDKSENEFREILGRYLTQAYQDFLTNLEEIAGESLWEIWYNYYREACHEFGLMESWDDKYHGNREYDVMIGRSTIFSEILKSGYSTVLDYLFNLKIIGVNDFFDLTLKNFPVDPSIWEIPMTPKPNWWPRIITSVPAREQTEPLNTIDLHEDIIYIEKNKLLLHMHGVASPFTEHYEDETDCQISVIPFMYTGLKQELPVPEKLFRELRFFGRWHPIPTRLSEFETFENPLQYFGRVEQYSYIGKSVFPLVGRLWPCTSHIWQYYRWLYDCMLLHPNLAKGLQLVTDPQGIRYTKGKSEIAWQCDFADGVREQADYRRLVPAGRYTIIDRKYMEGYLKTEGKLLGYVVEITLNLREHYHTEKVQSVTDYRFMFPT